MNDDFDSIHPDLSLEKEESAAKTFLNYLETAKKSGLELEFVVYFLRDFKNSQDVDGACWHAACEWDI